MNQTYSYDASGQLESDGTIDIDYGPNGSRVEGDVETGLNNRLTKDQNYDYGYDPEGNRVSKSARTFDHIFDISPCQTEPCGDYSFIDSWQISTDGYGGSQQTHSTSTGGTDPYPQFHWNLGDLPAGDYAVYATWAPIFESNLPDYDHYGAVANFATYTQGSSDWSWEQVDFSQDPENDLPGSTYRWEKLSTLEVTDEHPSINVFLSVEGATAETADNYYHIIADAIRVVRVSTDVPETRYEWDHRNRLSAVLKYSDAAATQLVERVDYAYDVLDRRVAKMFDADGNGSVDKAEYYTVDRNHVVVAQQTSGGATAKSRLLWGTAIDQLLAMDEQVGSSPPKETTWALPDREGTVRDLIGREESDVVSELIQTKSFNAFGREMDSYLWFSESAVERFSDIDNGLAVLYTGQQYDGESGFQYSQGRYYDPFSRQFVSQNPLGLAADTNLYRFQGNSPGNSNASHSPIDLGIGVAQSPGFWQAGGMLSNVLGIQRDCYQELSVWLYEQEVSLSNTASNSDWTLVSWLATIGQYAAATGNGISQGAANMVGMGDVPSLVAGISHNYDLYAQHGIGTWDATVLTFNPLTGAFEAGYGESYQAADFLQELDSLDRFGRGIQSAVNTAGTALGGVVGLRSALGVMQIDSFGQAYSAGSSRLRAMTTALQNRVSTLYRTVAPRRTTILGNAQTSRVVPFAERTGARALDNGLSEAQWNALSPRQRWKVNDGQLRKHINAGDRFRDIGPDGRVRSMDLRKAELLRLRERGIPVERLSSEELMRILGK